MSRIIYYSWNEYIKNDGIETLKKLGHEVQEYCSKFEKYDFDEKNMNALKNQVERFNADIVFSFNYYPDVSRVALDKGILYISWVYDSPHYTLESITLNNSCNRIFMFDSNLVEYYRAKGITNVYYSPLPARIIDKVDDSINKKEYKYNISFVGSLYDGEQDQYGQIASLPDKMRGKLDGIINGQHQIYGVDLIDEVVNDKFFSEISNYVKLPLGDLYSDCDDVIFRNILKRRVTMFDRISSLGKLGSICDVDLFSGSHLELSNINNNGTVDHKYGLVDVIRLSKVNMNISLRSITSGIPLRVLHILGCGGFCLTNFQPDLMKHFEDRNHLVWYYSEDEMMDMADYYLRNDEEREKVAKQGYEYVRENLSYEALFKNILNICSQI